MNTHTGCQKFNVQVDSFALLIKHITHICLCTQDFVRFNSKRKNTKRKRDEERTNDICSDNVVPKGFLFSARFACSVFRCYTKATLSFCWRLLFMLMLLLTILHRIFELFDDMSVRVNCERQSHIRPKTPDKLCIYLLHRFKFQPVLNIVCDIEM